jgi:hypothetical protein
MLLGYAMSEEGRLLSLLASGTHPGKLCRETPFRVNDDGLLMVGSTDIFWEDGEYIDLRDWKTTSEEECPCLVLRGAAQVLRLRDACLQEGKGTSREEDKDRHKLSQKP